MAEPKLKDFVPPTFSLFEGNSDPMEHALKFQQKMTFESRNEAMLCNVVSTTLVGSALIWFHQLLEKSISSFEDFCTSFMMKYGSNR